MKLELEIQLVNKYPTLYRQYGGAIHETCLCWGFECADGWYDIIDRLSEKLEPLQVEAAQVKEKFGTLRFYIDSMNKDDSDIAHKFIFEAEKESASVCEFCGKPGTLRKGSWWKTLCDKCNTKE